MTERIVHCRLLKKDLPGLDRPPYKAISDSGSSPKYRKRVGSSG